MARPRKTSTKPDSRRGNKSGEGTTHETEANRDRVEGSGPVDDREAAPAEKHPEFSGPGDDKVGEEDAATGADPASARAKAGPEPSAEAEPRSATENEQASKSESAQGPWHAADATGAEPTPHSEASEDIGHRDERTESEPVPGTLPGAGARRAEPPVPPTPPVPPEPPRARRRDGFLALLLGGVLAGLIGFAVAWYLIDQGLITDPAGADEDLAATLAAQQERLAGLETELTALRDEVAGVPETAEGAQESAAALREDVDALQAARDEAAARMAEIETTLADVQSRLNAVERQPIDASEAAQAAVESYQRELTALREEIEALAARMEEVTAEAEAAQQAAMAAEASARARTALRLVATALDDGAPFAAPVSELAYLGLSIPDVLAANAETGVPTLAELQAAFPPAARNALAVARREAAEDAGIFARFMAFLRTQTGARSLTAQEGNDPDAILSRAEAALAAGNLEAALAEVSTLPPPALALMEPWIALAEVRRQAVAAVAELSTQIESL